MFVLIVIITRVSLVSKSGNFYARFLESMKKTSKKTTRFHGTDTSSGESMSVEDKDVNEKQVRKHKR